MANDLTRGAYSGKETFLYYNSGTHETPVWKLVKRASNISINDGPALSDVEFHGAANTSQIPGYQAFNGSFDYVAKRGADTVLDAIRNSATTGAIIEFAHLNGDIDVDGSTGWRAPCIIGEFAQTASGGDPVSATVPFSLADAYDSSDNVVEREFVVSQTGALNPIP